MPARLEVQVSKARTLRLLVLTCVLLAGAYFCTTLPRIDARVVGWVGIGFCTLGFIAISRQLFNTGPQVIVDEHGIEDRRSKFGLIEWSDVAGLSIGEIHKQRFLCIEVIDAKKYLGRLPAAARVVARSNRGLGFPEITLGFSGLSHTAEEVMSFIREHYVSAHD